MREYSLNKHVQSEFEIAFTSLQSGKILVVAGQTGTGKSHFVQTLAEDLEIKPMVAFHCSGLSPHRFESQLFGHQKGAFTGADRTFKGLVGEADEGILCLEELEQLSIDMQAKLLRFLELRQFRRLGDNNERHFRGYLVFTSQAPLAALLERGLLREDMYFRLASHEIRLPNLDLRLEDWAHLLKAVEKEITGEIPDYQALPNRERNWLKENLPEGNLHGLKKVIVRSFLTGKTLSKVPKDPSTHTLNLPNSGSLKGDLAILEKKLIERALSSTLNRAELAEILGISRRSLMYKLKEHGLGKNVEQNEA